LRELVADTLLAPACLSRGYYRPEVLRTCVDDHLAGRRDRARELWTLLTLELWHRTFIDRTPEPPSGATVPHRSSGTVRAAGA
jgi:asparagine synthase (glutamine-hydrolysing)